jgi:pentatricopeptide repeat protein
MNSKQTFFLAITTSRLYFSARTQAAKTKKREKRRSDEGRHSSSCLVAGGAAGAGGGPAGDASGQGGLQSADVQRVSLQRVVFVPPSQPVTRRDLHLACREGHPMDGHRIFEEARRDPRLAEELDAAVFNSLFTSCANEGLGRLALKTLAKMRKLNFHPTRDNLQAIIEAVSKTRGKDSQMEQMAFLETIVFGQHWRDKFAFGPDLLTAYARLSEKFDTVDATLKVMRQMAQNKRMDKYIFTKVVSMYVDYNQIAQMARLCAVGLGEFGLTRDARVFLVMMKGFSQLKTDQRKLVFELYDHMLQEGIPIDKYILTVVLRTAKLMRKFDRAAKIVEMLEQNPYKIAWDLQLLNELMAVASHAKDAAALVERILREMDSRKIPVDVNSYNLRITLYGRLKRIDESFDVMREMGRNGVQPNEATFTSLLTACRACRDPDRAFRVFESMRQSRLPLDNPIHGSLFESIFVLAGRDDLNDEWRRLVAEWKQETGGRTAEEMHCPTPHKKSRVLSTEQLKRAKRVSPVRRHFQRLQAQSKD